MAVSERITPESLEDAISRTGSAVTLLRNAEAPPYAFPVTPEFSNWRSEQHAWRQSCALFDQSHHMTDLFLKGPDALGVLSHLGVNDFTNFQVDRAKQFIAVNPDGYLIGDGILFYLAEESFDLVVPHPLLAEWVLFNIEKGGYDLSVERDDDSVVRTDRPPTLFRYELQGPKAVAIVEKLTGQPVPEVKFFHMDKLAFAGLEVRTLRHGMAGQPGFEVFGPWEQGERVRDAILEAGRDFGLVQAGAKAYATANLESGWVPSPLSAIFSGEAMGEFRAWMNAKAAGSLGGSFLSEDIADYYLTPYDLGYGRMVAFDHDFVGRGALEKHADNPRRTKVTLVWNPDDVAAAIGTLFRQGKKAKYMDLPKCRYARYQYDAVLQSDKQVGVSLDCGCIANEEAFVSLASIDAALGEPGTEVTVLWGEEPNSSKPQVEPHKQVEIRATVAPAPYAEFARSGYRSR